MDLKLAEEMVSIDPNISLHVDAILDQRLLGTLDECADVYLDRHRDFLRCTNLKRKITYQFDPITKVWVNKDGDELYDHVRTFFSTTIINILQWFSDHLDEITNPNVRQDIIRLGRYRKLRFSDRMELYQMCSTITQHIYEPSFRLNCALIELPISGGVMIDLHTLTVRDRTHHDLWSYELNVTLTQDTPTITRYMLELAGGNEDDRLNLQLVLGYLMTGMTFGPRIFVFTGTNSGKSTVLRLMKQCLGNLVGFIPDAEFASGKMMEQLHVGIAEGVDHLRRNLFEGTVMKLVVNNNIDYPRSRDVYEVPFKVTFESSPATQAYVEHILTHTDEFFTYICQGAQMVLQTRKLIPF